MLYRLFRHFLKAFIINSIIGKESSNAFTPKTSFQRATISTSHPRVLLEETNLSKFYAPYYYVRSNPKHTSSCCLHAKPSFTASIITSSSAPIISAISKTDELTAVEAIFPFINHLVLTPYQLKKVIFSATKDYSQVGRIFLFSMLGYLIPFITAYIQKNLLKQTNNTYIDTKSYHVTNHIRQGLFLGALNNFVDCILDGVEGLGLDTKLATIISNAFTSVSFTIWAMFRMRCYKNFLINFLFNAMKKKRIQRMTHNNDLDGRKIDQEARMNIRVRLLKDVTNYLLYVITGVVILNLMGVKYDIALKMISGIGTVGTLVVGLACREIAEEVVSGILLASQRPFKLGDMISYGNNKSGTVVKMDLLYTVVKGEDEIVTKIPNSDLNYNTFSNLSRIERSQVHQKLRFTYDSLDKMPELVATIKKEITLCPKLINDKSSPLKVYFNSFEEGYLEVIVDARFKINSGSDEFHQIKEEVLNAIGKSAKSCDVEFYSS